MFSKLMSAGLILSSLLSASAGAAARGRILVIVSSRNTLQLQDGKTYPTGFYLNELTVPVRAAMAAGYEIVFADPKGNTPSMDTHSDDPKYFGGDVAKYQSYRAFLNSLEGLKHPVRIIDAIRAGLDQFDGVFFPGGHAPMIDLLKDPGVHVVLQYFHSRMKPTALICHGPISLLAALPTAPQFDQALAEGNLALARSLAPRWIYAGYRMTIFSTAEEQHAEAVQLGGRVLFYPDLALATAGGNMAEAAPWTSNAIRDRELITGQNPFSDQQLAGLFLNALAAYRNR